MKSAGLKIIHAKDEMCKYFQLSEEIYLSTPKNSHYAKKRFFFFNVIENRRQSSLIR